MSTRRVAGKIAIVQFPGKMKLTDALLIFLET
jgi:hypothetical protein